MSWRALRSLTLAPLTVSILAIALLPSFVAAAAGDRSSDRVWTEIFEPLALKATGALGFNEPTAYRSFSLDHGALQDALRAVPHESAGAKSRTEFTIPLPDGKFARFFVTEYALLSEELAVQRPGFRTYYGQGVDDPSSTLRMDITNLGFSAQVLSARGTVVVDPYVRGNKDMYMSFWRRDLPTDGNAWRCHTGGEAIDEIGYAPKAIPVSGNTLYTYRMALTGTGEYTSFWGSVPTAESRMTTTINRVNQVYERDVAVRYTITAFNMYTDPAADPFPTGTTTDGNMLNQNDNDLDAKVGFANYDIGHVFTRSAGTGSGIAQIQSACGGAKGRGASGGFSPSGDMFDINIVAHEIGHQMGALHTFNGSTGACDGNRSGGTAYEPGSGVTIMSYAGICGGENVEPDGLPMLHVISLEQIISFRNTGGSCAATSGTGNTPPVSNAGANITVPQGTPFVLTGSGSDSDTGDELTYSWEQYDLGLQSPPTDPLGPLFRSFEPQDTPIRTVPALDLLLVAGSQWEILPTVDRGVTWRLVVRDNKAGGGGADDDEMEMTVFGAPFVVTHPNSFTDEFRSLEDVTVTWDVGGGSIASEVRIRLTADAGQTFFELSGPTANDGSETVTMPCLDTTTARILVEAVDGVFFDVSNFNFAITQQAPVANAITAVVADDPGDCVITTNFFSQISDDAALSESTISVEATLINGTATVDPPTFSLIPQTESSAFVSGILIVRDILGSPAEVEVKVIIDDNCQVTETTEIVIVSDTLDPFITCPADIMVSTTDPGGVPAADPLLEPFFNGISAADSCDSAPELTNDAPATFPEGVTAVTFTATDSGGNSIQCMANVTVDVTTDAPGVLTNGTGFRTIYPNPFNPRTKAMFSVGVGGAVQVDVHNMQGQLVRRLFSGTLAAGDHQVEWNGMDDAGHSVASGVYVFTLKSAQGAQSRAVALIK